MSLFNAFRFDMLTHPWMLGFLVLVAVLFLLEVAARPSGTIRVSTGDTLARIRGHRGMLLRRMPPLLRALGLAFLLIALARPLNGMRPRVESAEVKDILLCVDASGSMLERDLRVGNRLRDRLYVTKEAVRDFVDDRKIRSTDRYGLDRLGLVLYGSRAWIQCPLTLDYGVFERELDRVQIDRNDEKTQRTAIGSALGLAVANLDKSEAISKVIILLTDGINNSGNLDPITAAEIAKEFGIRVYTIGAGSTSGGVATRNTPFGPISTGSSAGVDEETLRRIASITGGKYYRATDTKSLRGAYQEINELEATEIEIGNVYDYDDGFVPYALVGTGLMAVSILSRRRWFESVP
jgi:Ca-activated chloride channel family protein